MMLILAALLLATIPIDEFPAPGAALPDAELATVRPALTAGGASALPFALLRASDTAREVYENWAIEVAGPLIAEARERAAQGASPLPAGVATGLPRTPADYAPDVRIATVTANIRCGLR